MRAHPPGAALAPLLALLSASALLSAPDVGRAQTAPAAPKPPSQARKVLPPRPAPAGSEPGVLHVDLSTAGSAARVLNLPYGKSAMVDLPADARDVLVTNPAVADAVLRTRRRISILGVSPGDTDAVFFDDAGRRILSLDIHVGKDSSGLAGALGRLLPGSNVRVESVNDSLVLAGEVASAADADKARRLAERFVAKPEQVVNLLTITGRDQVMVKVRIVEMQRSIIKQLGFNLNAVTGQLGMPQYAFGNSPTFGVNGNFLGAGSAGYALDTTANPVAAAPFGAVGAGVAGIPGLARSAGIGPANLSTIVSQFLTGSGAMNAAQSAFSKSFLSGLIGSVSTEVTPAVDPVTPGVKYTVTAPLAGINANNIAQFEQAYVNNTTLPGGVALTSDQKLWMNAFNKALPDYYNQSAANLLAKDSTYIDRTNAANYVQRGTAGATGLNQAQAMIQAFERVGLVRTLAEPNLTAISGEAAKFLAGGEFPVPVGEDATGRVTVEFKPYGVGLGFTPVVLSEGRISMKIATEVSELTTDGGFTLAAAPNAASGQTTPTNLRLNIPGLKVRRTETTVELPSGGAMMIAGLLQQQTKQNLDSLPGMANLPVLGALFRSRDYLAGETELVVIVTPYLVKPTSPDKLQTPADGFETASDLETDLLGKMTHRQAKAAPAAPTGQTLQGPYGYIVE